MRKNTAFKMISKESNSSGKSHRFEKNELLSVHLRISSWRAKGLTKFDFELAKKYDEVYEKMK
nr:4a-hydroxytetrahydrobiopterin dehydratase [Parageobacillus sp. VR-IP]